MKNMRYGLIALSLLLCTAMSATAGVSIGIGLPNVSIGINLPLFPELVPVPGYPVYYAPQLDANYFFYDGMYWVYQDDNWYASSWYNGPWALVEPDVVPLFILRIPVRYYRQPPVYFRGWQSNAPPRWGLHWGRGWEQRRSGWDRWKRGSAPAPAPLPVYQQQYTGDRYPRVEQQHTLRSRQYRYQPREQAIRQHFQQPVRRDTPVSAPVQRGIQEDPGMRRAAPQEAPVIREQRQPPAAAQSQREQQPPREQREQQAPREQREQQAPRSHGQEQRSPDRGDAQEPNRGHGQGQGRDDDRGRGRDK